MNEKRSSERVRDVADKVAAGFSHELADDLRREADHIERVEWQHLLLSDLRILFYQCAKHEPPFVWRLPEGVTEEPCPRCALQEHRCDLPASISEALNSGDGAYRP